MLRRLVPKEFAVVGIDLADDKQVLAVCDHDGGVHGRKTVRVRAWQMDGALEWAQQAAASTGFAGLVVACEPTGHRWRVLVEQCDRRGLTLVCVQPLLVHREREREDYTHDRSDPKDAVLIAGLAAQLRCYLPERPTAQWARLRHLASQRTGLVVDAGAARQRIRALLECAWPAALGAAAHPLDSMTWLAAMTVITRRLHDGDLQGVRRMGWRRYQAAVRRELPAWGGQRVAWRIATALWDALGDDIGVAAHRHGALERVSDDLADFHHLTRRRADVEARMAALLDDLDLTDLATSIPGLTAIGAATILAETGDPTRYGSARALVKHAGLAPRDNESGTYKGRSRISGRGRPGLRLAAWRAVWAALPHNPVLAARHTHLTTRPDNPLSDHQARVALAGALLRQLHAVITTGVPWDARIAAGHRSEVAIAA